MQTLAEIQIVPEVEPPSRRRWSRESPSAAGRQPVGLV